MRPIALLAISVVATSLSPLSAQQVSFFGVVSDSVTGDPLAGVSVSIVGQAIEAFSNEEGHFEVAGVGGGTHTILLRSVGFQPWAVRLDVNVSRPTRFNLGSIDLPRAAVELDPLAVEADEVRRTLAVSGFLQRQRSEKGTFITRDEIAELDPQQTSHIIRRVPGFTVARNGRIASSRGVPSLRQGFSECFVTYYIDGVESTSPSLDVILPDAIAGIEVYTGSASIPPRFRGIGNPKCGIIAIWTRSGGDRNVGRRRR
jgi:hypothetical protein